ncbi:MAG: amidase [Acidimicrobiales bacterium]|jgi:amidase
MDDELTWKDATAQAELVRRGEVSPLELVEAAIERIERCDPALNAVIHRQFSTARARATGELPRGPFEGVPMLLKDLGAPQKGELYCEGTSFAKAAGYRAGRDSFLVERFKKAGFVVVGRTNTPELGTTITTEPVAFGPTRNPWNTGHTSGGSSGGSAAAVASGMVPVAHGNDGAGSIRVPASCCGLFGLKPSRGRVSPGPGGGESWNGFSIDHVLTRSVRDSAAVLDQIAGYRPGDTYLAPPPARPFAHEVGANPGRLRIGLLDHPVELEYGAHPECAQAVQAAGRLLESLGHKVELAHPSSLEEPEMYRHFLVVVTTAVAAALSEWSQLLGREISPEEFEPDNLAFTMSGRSISAPDYLESLSFFGAYRRRTIAFWSEQGFDLLCTPVLAQPPALIGELSDPATGRAKVVETLQFTRQFNASGQPAASLPLHWTPEGLPVGVQLVADYGREDVLIRVSSQLEEATAWTERRPVVTPEPTVIRRR